MRRFLKVGCFGMLLFITFASSVGAQQCVLKVGAWEAYPEEKSGGGVIHRRKETVTGFTSTATNLRTKRLYKGVSLMGHAYYENLPEGNYSIIVRKAGFKTTIQPHTFLCANADSEFDFTDILVFRGKPSQIIKNEEGSRIPPRNPDRYTVLGNSEYDKSNSQRLHKQISGGVLNGKALSMPRPAYPPAARVVRAGGAVTVEVLLDEKGNVISATPLSGHPLLRAAASAAAREAKFAPTLLSGSPVRVKGVITYNFVPPPPPEQ